MALELLATATATARSANATCIRLQIEPDGAVDRPVDREVADRLQHCLARVPVIHAAVVPVVEHCFPGGG
jgi:hypothetical protein